MKQKLLAIFAICAITFLAEVLFQESRIANFNTKFLRSRVAELAQEVKAQDREILLQARQISLQLQELNVLKKGKSLDASKCISLRLGEKVVVDADCRRLRQLSARPEVQQLIAILKNRTVADDKTIELGERVLPAENPSLWQQRAFRLHGGYGFIQYSGYRIGANSFVSCGLSLRAFQHRNMGCRWHGNDGRILIGNATLLFEGWPFNVQYEAVVLKCMLDQPTIAGGGYVVAKVDEEEFVIYTEDAKEQVHVDPSKPFKHEVAFCGTALHGRLVPRRVEEWLEYHRHALPVDHFYFYNAGGLDGEVMGNMLKPYKDHGLLTVTDLSEIWLFSVKIWGQVLAITDCIHRNHYTAKWVFMGDIDEYLYVTPPHTLSSILITYGYAAYITHGCFTYHMGWCKKAAKGSEFAIEKLVFSSKVPVCSLVKPWDINLCLGSEGHRKYILNPRKVEMASTHLEWSTARGEGVHMHARDYLHHKHFLGLATEGAEARLCKHDQEAPIGTNPWFERNEELAKLAAAARSCPLGSQKGCYKGALEKQRLLEIQQENCDAKYKGYKFKAQADNLLNDLSRKNASSVEECLKECGRYSYCAGFVHKKDGGECYFKSKKGRTIANSTVDTYMKCRSSNWVRQYYASPRLTALGP